MEYIYHTTVCSMLQALVAGAVWGVYYDVFRMLRRLIGFSRVSIALQDVFFWLTSAFCLFFVCIQLNNGFIRIYFILFAFVGWGIYFATLGKMISVIFGCIADFVGRIFEIVRTCVMSGMAKIYLTLKSNR